MLFEHFIHKSTFTVYSLLLLSYASISMDEEDKGKTTYLRKNKLLIDIYQFDFTASQIDSSFRHLSGLDHVVVVGVVQQRLRRNATHVEAGSTQGDVLLDAHGLKRAIYVKMFLNVFNSN